MPHWGFSKEMVDTMPFGLSEDDLSPGKIFADPVHGDVYLTRLEVQVVDSKPFQRLRRTRQLGMTHLVYPGATHTRFSHSLGAVRTAQLLLDHAVEQRQGLHPVKDLFGEWESKPPQGRHSYLNVQLARATVVARLGALLHDICHVPYGHSIEDDLGLLESHDDNLRRLDHIWAHLPGEVRDDQGGHGLSQAVRHVVAPKLVAREEMPASDFVDEFPFVADLVGNTICADLVDYLPRDHAYAGLPIALGHRFLSAFFVTPETGNHLHKKRMALSISRDGHERADIASELLKYLRYRYELTERVLTHHAKLRADAMIGVLIGLWKDLIRQERAAFGQPSTEEDVTATLEEQLLAHGDEGLLEHLSAFNDGGSRVAERIGALATDLLDRKLFRQRGRFGGSRVIAEQLNSRRKDMAVDFREVIEGAADFVGVDGSKVALWIPPAEMNLKPAQVLVFDGSKVCSFVEYERDRGYGRGEGIETAHRDLWCARLFAHESVEKRDWELILAVVAKELEIPWEELDNLGADTYSWPDQLVVRDLLREVSEGERPDEREVLEGSEAMAKTGDQEPQDAETLRTKWEKIIEAVVKRHR
jgi:HD superfamily phosphohydrolase